MRSLLLFLLLPALALLAGCNDTDCTMDNTVGVRVVVRSSATGAEMNLPDALSVVLQPKDTVILNRAQQIAAFTLPLSFTQAEDRWALVWHTEAGQQADYVTVRHTNRPHFESLDCGTAYFHTLTGVALQTQRRPSADFPTAIDSIVINNPSVDYAHDINLTLYLSRL